MNKARFERPLLPIPTREIERLPYAKPGNVRRIFYCPCCERQMMIDTMAHWLEYKTNIQYSWNAYIAFKEKFEINGAVRIVYCMNCEVHIAMTYQSLEVSPENIRRRFSTEELYDFIQSYEEKSLFD